MLKPNEDTFGKIMINSESVQTDFSKNHQVTLDLCVGSHSITIEATDPSANKATESFDFTVQGEWEECSQSGRGSTVNTQDETSLLSSTTIQIAALVITLLVTLALIRTRRDVFQ